uniref:Uncharacterized protein n=1 Tax=Saccharum spontaneum TaxID=62335 RepID=A0A678TGY5_SACSP|nr:hypothetical protein SS88P14_000007 [Saccharum spontaneum]
MLSKINMARSKRPHFIKSEAIFLAPKRPAEHKHKQPQQQRPYQALRHTVAYSGNAPKPPWPPHT